MHTIQTLCCLLWTIYNELRQNVKLFGGPINQKLYNYFWKPQMPRSFVQKPASLMLWGCIIPFSIDSIDNQIGSFIAEFNFIFCFQVTEGPFKKM